MNDNYINNKKILDFIKKQKLAVISTINKESNPQSGVIAFAETDHLELIFGTFNNTRKYTNLLSHPHVSFVIGWNEEEKITIQYEGIAKEVKDQELEKCREIHLHKNPASKKYAFHPLQRFFLVKPMWIRYSNLSSNPEEIVELIPNNNL